VCNDRKVIRKSVNSNTNRRKSIFKNKID